MPLKRVPTIGSDNGNWGQILNDNLSQLTNPLNGGINKFDIFSQRPTTLTADDVGKTYLYTQTGNIHQWDGTNWKVLNQSEVNVKDYGAVGDGVVDDTVAVQTCVDYVLTRNALVPIVFRDGVYKITSTITMDYSTVNHNLGVKFDGLGSKILGAGANGSYIFEIIGKNNTAPNTVQAVNLIFAPEFHNMYFYTNNVLRPSAIKATSCEHLLVSNCRFERLSYGVESRWSSETEMTLCQGEGNSIGFLSYSTRGARVNHTHFFGGDYGLYFDSQDWDVAWNGGTIHTCN
jgi:hypothetical protein